MYVKIVHNERQLRNKASVTHLASQVGCSVEAARTVDAAGTVVAEMSSAEGEVESFVRKISFKPEPSIPGAYPDNAGLRWNTEDGGIGFVWVSPDTKHHQTDGQKSLPEVL